MRVHIRTEAKDAAAAPSGREQQGGRMPARGFRLVIAVLPALFAGLAVMVAVMAADALAPVRAAEAYQADPKLVEAARKEGEVVLYTTLIVDQIVRPMIKAFNARIGGIDVKFVRTDSSQQMVKLINEGRAGRVQADIWHLSDGLAPLLKENLVAPLDLPSARGLPDELVDPKGNWVGTNLSTRSLAYNTQLVPADKVPRTHQDLLDPRWKGQFVWHPYAIPGGYGFIGLVLKSMGEENGMRYLRALAKQNIIQLPIAARAVLDRVIAGEYPMGLEMNSSHAVISAALGAPVRFVPLDPVTMTLQIAGISRGAPHPNAARLFLDFMISRAGQEVFADVDYIPMRPDVAAKSPEVRPETGGYRALMLSPDDIDANARHWAKVYDDIFR
jgi:ABC-type Fe3+ transport system substrate-binding protein